MATEYSGAYENSRAVSPSRAELCVRRHRGVHRGVHHVDRHVGVEFQYDDGPRPQLVPEFLSERQASSLLFSASLTGIQRTTFHGNHRARSLHACHCQRGQLGSLVCSSLKHA